MKKLLVLFLLACGGSPKPAAPPAAPVVWKDMNADQRMAYMKDIVLPQSKAIFVAFDPKYQTMDCATCHGDGVEKGDYEMPNAKIKPLPATPEAFMAWVEKDAEAMRYTKFMAGEVEPLMGKLLSMSVFDPKTNTGDLNCSKCHTLVGGKPE